MTTARELIEGITVAKRIVPGLLEVPGKGQLDLPPGADVIYGIAETEGRKGSDVMPKLDRIEAMADTYLSRYGDSDVALVSAPGRLEILGNFQDNGQGVTLSAAIRRDVLALTGIGNGSIRVVDHHYEGDLDRRVEHLPDFEEYRRSPSEVKWHGQPIGIGFQLKQLIHDFGGFNMVVDGIVPDGSGCSSSAASENAMTLSATLAYDMELGIHEIARISKRSENLWRGKGCGWLDQLTSMVGGIVFIDYSNADAPAFATIDKPFFSGYKFVTVMADNEGHGNLDDKYNQIRQDLDKIARRLGFKVMNGNIKDYYMASEVTRVDPDDRDYDRALLRADFFVDEYLRVLKGLAALQLGDATRFGKLMSESGQGSKNKLLNTNARLDEAVERGERYGAHGRVHGGGFKGGVIFMTDLPDELAKAMGGIYGHNNVIVHDIRKGACRYI